MESNDVEEEEFGFSRNYFLAKELRGSGKRSVRKLSDINLVDEQELREAYTNIEPKHEKEINDLMRSYKNSYSEWVFVLRSGFGLLMYGFGSKKALIEDFASTALADYSVVVINGYLQSVNLKQVAATLAELLWDQLKMQRKITLGNHSKNQQPFNTRSMDDLISFLDGPHLEEDECFVCLIVNNIDGPALRDSDTQQYLARIAACSHIRMIASIDHVNAPLWMPFNNLYTICRERFLVSSQITLNAHLTEFKDHELVKTRRNQDGEDCLYIPLTGEALEKLVQEISQ
ncbi:hypothetical protein BUALT_Bualt01G0037700 [Buddleja alternifolia]|uniref:Origin recognition complex subunit 2 n=1 Tax=Buddleja alternifolia TaxID=168488 RepID=A0AAV6Y580_9LAMI|nr:hypothetical protein BUALT_Bualt01G0037700 [Buddleja alternifolia]